MHKIREHCNSSLVGGKTTGIYQFETNLYGQTQKPAEMKKAINPTQKKLKKHLRIFGRYIHSNKRNKTYQRAAFKIV